ncbi:hypothetical protein CK203_094913 [Vitis vinifera]|uniref:Uncharacterized protein n=1 Tax=Vitis vinifera TaxID=29760 RepID=A0A438DN95_VITVI|nr:hypothetical protein CK203_094913 [Vitis vinifera]
MFPVLQYLKENVRPLSTWGGLHVALLLAELHHHIFGFLNGTVFFLTVLLNLLKRLSLDFGLGGGFGFCRAGTIKFVGQVNASITLLHPIHCTRQRKVDVEFDMTTIPAFLIVLGVLWLVLRPRRPKPKIN